MTGVRAILDFPGPAGTDTRLVFTAPTDVLETGELSQVRPLLRRVDQAVRAGCHAVGFVAYEAAPAFDPAMVTRAPNGATPLVWFALFGAPTAAAPPPCTGAAPPAVAWSPDSPRADYDAAISRIRDAIAAGDVYQVNHTLRFTAADVAAASWYDARVAARQGLYHALIETPDWSIACASPELFLDAAGRRITARPMKGTVRRGRWTGEDAAAAAALAGSAKDRAENLMIVDLLRNDLGRIAEFGSVAVPRMYDVETYPTVHQLTSTVTARLRHGIGVDDIFAATFPCGSVTGAPKIAAMRAIAALERAPRGPYCGAIGIMRPDGSFTFNVGIRTLLVDHLARTSVYGAGGGITWDSNAAAEYDEVLAKAALLDEHTPCFDLLETLRLDDGVYSRLPRHLARLADSARYWGFSDDTASNVAAALERERRAAGVGAWRVRVTAGGKGEVEVTRTGGEGWEGAPDCAAGQGQGQAQGQARARAHAHAHAHAHGGREVRLARRGVSRGDRLLFHKTTARGVYESRRGDFGEGEGRLFDVLLWNEEGQVTEFTNGNAVACIDGVLRTPPLDCGLLAGTMRAELLAAGVIVEEVITLDDLRHADGLWLINSVRGWVPVTLTEEPGAS